jgi:tetratricopeptide (TPR) repeat protein
MKEIGESGFHLYSQSYDRQVQDIFDVQNEIAREIAGALLPRLGLGKDVVLVKHGTTNLEAYSLTLQARRWLTAPDPVTSSTAIEMLRRALALDPHYWDAWGDLAYIKGYMTSWNGDPVPLWVDAESAAMAADYYERARRAGVDQSLWAFQKAFCYDGTLGRFDAAIEELRDAARNDPLASSVKGAHASCWTDPAHLSGKITPAACSCSSRSTRRPRRHDSMVDQGRRATRDLDVDADGCAQSQSPSHREGPTLPCAAAADGARREQSVIANSRFAAAGLEREPP